MSSFDSVIVNCPSCGNEVEFQSKARGWNCSLKNFKPSKVPVEIALDLDCAIEQCSCGAKVELKYSAPTKYVSIEVGLIGEIDEDNDNLF